MTKCLFLKKTQKIGYVFVAVGAQEHLDTLHDVLPLWKASTHNPILVVTDNKRNVYPIEHDRIIDIDIPESFDHHQAAILLKTGLYEYVNWDLADTWVYLDTDILPVRLPVENIIDQFYPPITFAPDHCTMQEFALSAVRHEADDKMNAEYAAIKKEVQVFFDEQLEHQNEHASEFNSVVKITNAYRHKLLENEPSDRLRRARDSYFQSKKTHKTQAIQLLETTNKCISSKNRIKQTLGKIQRFFLKKYFAKSSRYNFETDGSGVWTAIDLLHKHNHFQEFNITWNKKNNQFIDNKSNTIIDESSLVRFSDFAECHGLKYEPAEDAWYTFDGLFFWKPYPLLENIYKKINMYYDPERLLFKKENGDTVYYVRKSTALHERIKEDFQISIHDDDWQHWNGGVFVFDRSAKTFLNDWKQRCLDAFQLPNWKTRDQGTLIATVWDHNLQNHKTLPQEWNFIADYYKDEIVYKGNFEFQVYNETIKPSLLHIYHHWGDIEWSLWRDCQQIMNVTNANE